VRQKVSRKTGSQPSREPIVGRLAYPFVCIACAAGGLGILLLVVFEQLPLGYGLLAIFPFAAVIAIARK
jgi:hypothetical protein